MQSERSFWPLALGIFAAFVGVLYFPVFLGKIPFPREMVLQFPIWQGFPTTGPRQQYADIGDLVTSFYPFRALLSRAVGEGMLPLWNPYMLAGSPFLANSQSALFYPLNLLYYILPLPVAWTVCILLRTLLAAVFTALFVRSIGATRTGSILSGVIFSSCGFMTLWQGQPMGDAAIWLPLICYAVHRLDSEPSRLSLSLAAFAFAMPVLAGHPETAAHLTMTGLILALLLWFRSTLSGAKAFGMRFVFAFALAGILAMGLASIQVIPTLEWIGEVGRQLAAPWPALNLDHALGLVSRDIVGSPNSAGMFMPEGAAYLGMMTLLLASFAPFHHARRYVFFLTLITVIAVCAAYSIQPIHWLFSHTPGLMALKNSRLILVASFGLAALAGLGVSVLQEQPERLTKRRAVGLVLLLTAFLLSFFLVHQLQQATTFTVAFMMRPSFSRSLLLVSFIPIVVKLYGGLRGQIFPILICAIAVFDLGTFGYGAIGFSRPDEVFPNAPLFEFLKTKADIKNFRVAAVRTPYPPNAQMMFGIPAADGYEILLYRSHALLWGISENRLDGTFFVENGLFPWKDRRVDLLNVKYFITTRWDPDYKQFDQYLDRFSQVFQVNDTVVYENKLALPRAFLVPTSGVEIRMDIIDRLKRLSSPEFDPEQNVVLEERHDSPEISSSEPASSAISKGNVQVVESHFNRAKFLVQAPEPCLLIVSQTYYPGWKAIVDGHDADVFPADIALTGVSVPAGAYEVELVFDPTSVKLGAGLSLSSLIILAGLTMSASPRLRTFLSRRKRNS